MEQVTYTQKQRAMYVGVANATLQTADWVRICSLREYTALAPFFGLEGERTYFLAVNGKDQSLKLVSNQDKHEIDSLGMLLLRHSAVYVATTSATDDEIKVEIDHINAAIHNYLVTYFGEEQPHD